MGHEKQGKEIVQEDILLIVDPEEIKEFGDQGPGAGISPNHFAEYRNPAAQKGKYQKQNRTRNCNRN